MPTTSSQLLSSGVLCRVLGALPACIDRAADAAGVRPELQLNDVRYYSYAQIERIRAALQESKS
jgi:hypothetical protein